MNIPYRPIALGLVALAFSGIFLARAQAGGGHYFAPVSDAVTREECGSCHLAFAPSMLPASSWKRMLAGLNRHFGTDASITELPRWVRKHNELPAKEWKRKEVGSKANCVACHTGAERGYYDEP